MKVRNVILTIVMSIINITVSALTLEDFETRPMGFAGMTGTYAMPICNNGTLEAPSGYTLETVSSDSELSNALGSNKIICVNAGSYSSLSISGLNNVTILGLGNAVFKSGFVKGSSKNVLIRNLSFLEYGDDGLGITGAATNVWIDHCTIGWTKTSSNKESPDGAMDITNNSTTYITISWCKIMNAWKTSLHGSGDSDGATYDGPRHITHYCNYYVNTHQRTPRIRGGWTHVLNCLYENSGYGRPYNMTNDEHDQAVKMIYKDDGEYLTDRRVVSDGYAIMAAKQGNVNVDSCFFLDVRWPICASLPRPEFTARYGDIQSPDINNKSNSGCYAVRQRGNGYDDSGLLNYITIKANIGSCPNGDCETITVPLDYTYTATDGTERHIINTDMLNPGKRSIKFDEKDPENVWKPENTSGYYPTGYTKLSSNDVRSTVAARAGADTYTASCTAATPELTYTGELNQSQITTIQPITFTWGGGATGVTVTGIPDANKSISGNTLTISGSITALLDYTVSTKGGSGEPITYSGTLYPKGFSTSCGKMATINVEVTTSGQYQLTIYNAGGEEIKTVYSGPLETGKTSVMFSASEINGGDYTYKLLNDGSVVSGQTGTVTIP